jgi:GntR family transcriptional regulator
LINYQDSRPIYEQITERYKVLILKGVLAPDEQMPSVRKLAMELSTNPNTVQRAYAELERQGVIYALPGRGNFISPDIGAVAKQEQTRQLQMLTAQLTHAKNAGVKKEEILALLDAAYEDR